MSEARPEEHRAAPAVMAGALPARPELVPRAVPGAWLARVVWSGLFVVPTATIMVAAHLTPNPLGHGTHTQLGLPPCGFYVVTGLPCPGCGLTTCFSFMAHGDVVGATQANAFGVMLFLVSAFTALVALIGLVRGWPVIRTLDRLQADKWAILLAVSSLLVWVVRVVTILAERA